MAFDPDYATNGYFYVYYTLSGVGSRIARYTVSANPNVADPASAFTIIEQPQFASNHNGGDLHFGPDGYLYFAWGDGGGSGDSGCNAQKGDTLYGKMIRIDTTTDDFPADPTRNYGIPASNPFVGDATKLDEIYHLGLRNPWRWSFDPHTGDMYIGDVGQNSKEEVDFAAAGDAGLNFGWKIMEADNCFSTSGCPGGLPPCNDPSLTDPIHWHSLAGTASAVIGGVVYRGCVIPEEYGTYFFGENGDSGTYNNIWSFQYDPTSGLTDFTLREVEFESDFSLAGIRTFGHDFQGEVLIADSNEVFRVVADTRSFTPDACDISVSGGGSQQWTLDAGAAHGGEFYFIGGSLSGIAGIPSGSVTIPLTLDSYTLFSLAHPNTPPLNNTFAMLTGGGTGAADFTIGGGLLPASLVGTRAFHAYATLGAGFTANFASNPVSIYFEL